MLTVYVYIYTYCVISVLAWLFLMGFLSWFCVETKIFELSVPEGGSGLRLVERSRGVARTMYVGKVNVVWLSSVWRSWSREK